MRNDRAWGSGEPLDLRHYWNAFRREKWLILGSAFALMLVAASVSQSLPRLYAASATVLIEPRLPGPDAGDETYGFDARTKLFYQTQYEILRSRPTAETVIANLELLGTREFGPRRRPDPWSWRTYIPGFLIPAKAADNRPDPLTRALDIYAERLSIEPLEDTQLVRVRFESTSPERASRIANAHARAYIDSVVDDAPEILDEASAWMGRSLSEVESALARSEAELAALRAPLGHEPSQHSGLAARLTEIRSLIALRKDAYEQIVAAGTDPLALQPIPAILDDPEVRNAQAVFARTQAEVAELGKRYGPKHPTMVAALAERDVAKRNLDAERKNAAARVRQEYEAALAEEQALAASLEHAVGQPHERSLDGRALDSLERSIEANRATYSLLRDRVAATAAPSDPQRLQARVIESAVVSPEPVKPRTALIVGGTFIGTFVLGLMIAFVNDGMNNTLRSAQDIEEKLGKTMLAMVPLLTQRQLAQRQGGIIDNATYGESMRTLRSSILLDHPQRPHKVVLVTSATSEEGKSTLALNLAAAFARTGRALIIDADMRRPTIGHLLDLPRYDAGLSELITRAAPFKACLSKTKVPNLHVIRTGFIPEDPQQILAHRRLAKILRVLTRAYGHIVIDAPPILPVSDAAVLAKYADAVVFVAKADTTPVPQIENGLHLLERVNAPITGIVLNQIDMRKAARYSDFGYGGYYESYGAEA